jgi:hypothetical protein
MGTVKHILGDIFPSPGTIKDAFNAAVEVLKPVELEPTHQ